MSDENRPEQHAVGKRIIRTATAAEAPVLEAIDTYAVRHDLPGRSAVVRDALARLLDMPVAIPPKPTGS